MLYNIFIKKLLILKKKIRKLFKLKYIKLNALEVKIPVLFIKKLKRELRFYYDYRALNIIIVSDRTPLFLIIKTLRYFIKNKWFIKLNM